MGAGPAGLIPAVRLPSPRMWGAFREASCHARRPRPERAATGPRPGLVRCRPGLPPQPVASTSCGPAVLVAGAWGPGTSAPETRPCSLHPGRPACCPEPPCRPPPSARLRAPRLRVRRAHTCAPSPSPARPVSARTGHAFLVPWGCAFEVDVLLRSPRCLGTAWTCRRAPNHSSRDSGVVWVPSLRPSTLQRQETVGPRHTTMGRTEP